MERSEAFDNALDHGQEKADQAYGEIENVILKPPDNK